MLNYTYFKITEISYTEQLTNELEYIVIIQSLELHENPRAVLLLFVNKEYLANYIKQVAGSNLEKLTVTNNSLIIFDINFSDTYNYKPTSKDFDNKMKHLGFSALSNISTWIFNCTYNAGFIQVDAEKLMPLLKACVLSLIVGIFVAVLLARVTYKPLYRLFNKVKQNDSCRNNNLDFEVQHEYKLIETSFDKLITEKETMMRRIKEYENAAKSNLLLRLLKGYFDDDNLMKKLTELGLNYDNKCLFCVVLINEEKSFLFISSDKVNQKHKSLPKDDLQLVEKQKRLNLLINIGNLLDNVDPDYQLVETLDDDIAVIISLKLNEMNESTSYNKEKFLKEVIESFREKISTSRQSTSTGIKPIVSIGSIEKGIIGISKSYQTAKEKLESAVFGVDLLGNPKEPTQDKFYYYPTDWEIQLINNLKVGKLDTVTRIIDEIRLENENRQLSLESLKRLITLIMETIIRVLNELNINVKIYQKEFRKLLMYEDIENLWSYLYEVSSRICERSKYANDSDNANLGKTLLHYVNENYTNPNLSLKELSEVFSIPISTVSKLFKDVSGINFYDYLCRLRMEKAKELLKEIGYDLGNIAISVGYESEYSFKRAFLRYEGIRPRDYVLKVAGR